ncbi:MAG: hypothetical protein JRJ66_09355 [Deltaproteobacteria bacterium]|nr:hypothetical protein [Deltaproteobacteria bacterium]
MGGEPPVNRAGVHFETVAHKFPRFKTVVRLYFEQDLDLDHLLKLCGSGAHPLGGDLLDPLGHKAGIFFTRAGRLGILRRSGLARSIRPLFRFRLSGLYRVHFKVVEPGFSGPIRFRVFTPRDGFGKKLIHIDDHVSPSIPFVIEKDLARNRWLKVEMSQAKTGSTVKFDFYFIYQVDIEKILEHALDMVPLGETFKLAPGSPASVYLAPSPKIDSGSPVVKSVAAQIFGDEKAPRRLYNRLLDYIREHITYDQAKRDQFFGGEKIYHNMANMYQQH